jgi:hypothetical protein
MSAIFLSSTINIVSQTASVTLVTPKVLVTDIAHAIQAGQPKAEIKILIQQHIDFFIRQVTVTEWILEHKEQMIRWAFPDWLDFFIAYVKAKSGQEPYATNGQAELDDFIARGVTVLTYFHNFED